MLKISDDEIVARMRIDNLWWQTAAIPQAIREFQHRDYFAGFRDLVVQTDPHRAVVLMGPRRVGKTVMLWQLVANLIRQGVRPHEIFYVSLDTPNYSRLSLEKLLSIYRDGIGPDAGRRLFVFFDEVQYLKDWEVHLKSLVDSFRSIKFVASGSAAAALRLKSSESGAGRFTDFILPPLTFAEFLRMRDKEKVLIAASEGEIIDYRAKDIAALNEEFVRYLNFGGYPELIASEPAQDDIERYVRSDIVDKVLFRDLPSLYGIGDVRELNSLFAVLAFNSGMEVSLDRLSQGANIAKNTIRRYLEYLEAAFLIRRVDRVDKNAREFKRAVNFKVYLTNPALRAALFGQVTDDHEHFGKLAESAIVSQWMHNPRFDRLIRYARWDQGEVDIVGLARDGVSPSWALEIKWSDRFVDRPMELDGLIEFGTIHDQMIGPLFATTKTRSARIMARGHDIMFFPASLYCYTVGKNAVREMTPGSPPGLRTT